MQQVFSRATYDRIAKYILSSDNEVCVDILRSFSGLPITTAKQLDEHYNPFDQYSILRTVVNSDSFRRTMEKIQENHNISAIINGQEDARFSENMKKLANLYDDLISGFPSSRYRSTVDFLCESEIGYFTIEFQVLEKNTFNKRALAYVASIYGNQLRSGQTHQSLQNVIGINLLGDGSTPYFKDGDFKRHYCFTNKREPKYEIPAMQLIQYSLGDVDYTHPDLMSNPKLKGWIEFFKSAHDQKEIPLNCPETLKRAYELIRVDHMKKTEPELLIASEEFFKNIESHDEAVMIKGIEKGVEKGKLEMAKNMLLEGIEIDRIIKITGLDREVIQRQDDQ